MVDQGFQKLLAIKGKEGGEGGVVYGQARCLTFFIGRKNGKWIPGQLSTRRKAINRIL